MSVAPPTTPPAAAAAPEAISPAPVVAVEPIFRPNIPADAARPFSPVPAAADPIIALPSPNPPSPLPNIVFPSLTPLIPATKRGVATFATSAADNQEDRSASPVNIFPAFLKIPEIAPPIAD